MEIWESGKVVIGEQRTMAVEGIPTEGKEIKREERQTIRNICIYETKGVKEVMLRKKG